MIRSSYDTPNVTSLRHTISSVYLGGTGTLKLPQGFIVYGDTIRMTWETLDSQRTVRSEVKYACTPSVRFYRKVFSTARE
jgi:hypothetical protein